MSVDRGFVQAAPVSGNTPIDGELLAQQAEELSDQIEALENTRAALYAVYGYDGTWDHERKTVLDSCALLVRSGAEKLTEAHIGQLAHNHENYKAQLALAVEERTQLALINAEIGSKTRRYELAKERMANFRKASV